jgi:hypothetical protein
MKSGSLIFNFALFFSVPRGLVDQPVIDFDHGLDCGKRRHFDAGDR